MAQAGCQPAALRFEHLRLEQDGGGTAGGEFAEGKRHFGCRAQVLVDAGGRRQRLHGERISEMVGDADGVRRALRLQGLRNRHLEGGEDGLRLRQGQRSAPFFERVFDDAAGGGDVGALYDVSAAGVSRRKAWLWTSSP